ncbi:hypothetical protein ABK040_005147 [Willaertia magna]
MEQRSFPYMNEEEFMNFIQESNEMLSTQDAEYLYLKRRRLSMDMKREELNLEGNSEVYKIVILGDEKNSGKFDFYSSLITSHRKDMPYVIHSHEITLGTIKPFHVQVWMPDCEEVNQSVRQVYFEGTSVFVVMFNVNDTFSFLCVRDMLEEVRNYSQTVPVLIIGVVNEGGRDISIDEVFSLAQSYNCSKYIEIVDSQSHHVHDVCEQLIQILNTKEVTPIDNYLLSYFEILKLLPPEGFFQQTERLFELTTTPSESIKYYYSTEEEKVFKRMKLYKGPIPITNNIKSIRVVAMERCKYVSEVSNFAIPLETEEPDGYYDVLSRRFRIINPKVNCKYYLTIDGSTPNENSILYEEPGIYLLNNKYSEGHSAEIDINYPIVKAIAIEGTKFASKVKSFKPPEQLHPPRVYCSDGTLKIDVIPGVIYKYTIDGSPPNINSMTYSTPVLLPKEVKRIKVAAFPKVVFPSKYIQLNPKLPTLSNSKMSVKLTNTTINRIKSPTRPTTPSNTSNRKSSVLSPKQQKDFIQKKGIENPITVKKKSPTTPEVVDISIPLKKKSDNNCKATCKTEGSSVVFEFEGSVTLKNLKIKTPGNKCGPFKYSCFIPNQIKVGEGYLDDIEGEQTIQLIQGVTSNKLLCVFTPFEGKTSFKIIDMKISCQPVK